MLIKCPECGHNVSTEAQFCTNCGYPVAKMTIPQNEPQDDAAPEQPEADPVETMTYIPSDVTIPQKQNTAGSNTLLAKVRKLSPKTIGIIAVSLVAIITLIIILANGHSPIEYPYDLDPNEMTVSQMVKIMQQNGYIVKEYNNERAFFKSHEFMGAYTEELRIEGSSYMSFTYEESESYGDNNPSETFMKVKKELEKKYGSPQKDPNDSNSYYWSGTKCKIRLSYYWDGLFAVSYTNIKKK